MSTGRPLETAAPDTKGRRLYCAQCGSEIEIINPTPTEPPDQVFRCCGQDMAGSPGRDVNLGVE